ncbi:gephyrin-like molybdotransferase Glp [Rhodoferax saidenbachensis]|uniref:Molybdopterin molybdenumtransferase n=1 Tax=Rhodoferax saidenbachensis TaxID=1484693 RepID=A0A1P8K9C9_9BURK|nr:gephyrin-like molybdotransferase Glp [Rhodoferax saidenbachensis]APW42595.1 molybdopterin molybdenumtransferase MoeA [Rhodoferax saidenbachensis]
MSATPRAPLKPLNEALQQLLASAQPLGTTESVPTMQADGRVLAVDVVSALHVPPQDNSAMDGYALRFEDAAADGAELPVSQRIPAGSTGTVLQPHTAARIFTGAPIPEGADAVLMQEDCTVLREATATEPAVVRLNRMPLPGQNIRRAGEDVARGDVVLARGQRLGPAELGLAASIGLDRLDVVRRPRVALFSTGDELVMPGEKAPQDMPPGAIYNSNRFFLHSLLRRLGCEVTDFGIVPDQRAATEAALQQAAQAHDLILTSGGVSVGEEDHIKPAVQALGTLDLWQIAIKPGKPFAHGRVDSAHFIGLPGNPVSSFVTFLVLVRPFLLKLQGINEVAMKTIAARADFEWPKADKRQEFLRVRRNANGGLDLFPNQSSGVLTSAVWGYGLVNNPPNVSIAYGDTVQYAAFTELLA